MYYTSLRRLSILRVPCSLFNRSRRFSVQTAPMQPASLSKRSAFRVPSYTSHELQAMSAADLKNLMKENGLRYAGEKSTLVDRATRYIHQHPMTSGAAFSSRLHPQLSSKGHRARVQRKPERSAYSSSKKATSTQKPSALAKGASHQEIFGHDHDFGTKLAARAHFEGSSLSWAAPAPAPPVPQPNMFSSSQMSSASLMPHMDTPVWNQANLGNDAFHKSNTIGAKYGFPHKDYHPPLKVLHQETAKHTSGHTRPTPSVTAIAAAIKAKPAASKTSTVAAIKAKHTATAKATVHHADRSAKSAAQHKPTIAASTAKINAHPETKEGHHIKISPSHLATPMTVETTSGAATLKKAEVKSSNAISSKAASSTKTSIGSAAAALQREKAAASPSETTSTTSIFDLPKAAQPHLEKQIFQSSASAPKAPVVPKQTVQPTTSAPTAQAASTSVMPAKAATTPTASPSTSAKVNNGDGSMSRNQIKLTSASSSSTLPKSSSHASSSESKTGFSSSSHDASSSGSKTGSSSSSSSSSSSEKKAESSDGWSSDNIPLSTSAFPTLLGLGVIAWFIAGKRDRFLEAEARKREEERRLHLKRRAQIDESGEEVVLL